MGVVTPLCSLTQVAALHEALRSVLQTAVSVDADADRFPDDWIFAHRWGADWRQGGDRETVGRGDAMPWT